MATRVLVTGGAGFIGACLVRQLIAEGQEVHLLLRPGSSPWRLEGLHDSLHVHHADLRDTAATREAVRAARPEVVYHTAARGAAVYHGAGAASILESNVLGTASLLEALRACDYRVLVHTGSSSEYGHKERPMRAGDRVEPRSDYAVSKAASTLLCQAEALRGRPVTTVRIFSAYGPWEDPGRIASYVFGCALRGEEAAVTGGGQPRDFIYVDDVIALLRRAADGDVPGRILHAGTGNRQTVRDLVEAAIAVSGGPPARYGAEAGRSDEPAVWQADIEETTALTGWQPRYGLRAGVERMWEWFKAFGPPVQSGQAAA
jgi:nucleoside-diphosphate-sugar epimerase